MKKYLVIISAIVILMFSKDVKAALIASNNASPTLTQGSNTGTNFAVLQPLGTGYNVVSGGVSLFGWVTYPSSTVELLECPNSSYNTSTCSVVQNSGSVSITSGGTASTTINFTAGYTTNPSKYYAIYVFVTPSSQTMRFQATQNVSFPICRDEWLGGDTCQFAPPNEVLWFEWFTGTVTPILNFIFPTNATTTPTFSSYQITASGVTIRNYPFGDYTIMWSRSSSSLIDTLNPNNPIGTAPIYSSSKRYKNPFDILSSDLISYFPTGGTFATGTWYSKIYFYESSTDYLTTALPIYSDLIATSSIISFTVNTSTAIDNLPSQFNGQPFSTSNCTATSTFSVWSLSDWLCAVSNGITNFVGYVDEKTNGAYTNVSLQMNNLFLISPIIALNNDIDIAASSTYASSTIVLNGTGTFNGRSMVIYTATTTDWIKDKTGFDYKSFSDKVLYLITALFIILISVIVIKSMHEN